MKTMRLLGLILLLSTTGYTFAAAPVVELNQDTELPFTLFESGITYLLTSNLTLGSTEDGQAALELGSLEEDRLAGITIDLNGYTISVVPNDNNELAAISVRNASDIRIVNGSLTLEGDPTATTCNGIFATDFDSLTIEDVYFDNTTRGFDTGTSQDQQLVDNKNLFITRCIFEHPVNFNSVLRCGSIQTARIANSSVEGGAAGFNFFNNYRNIEILNCTFTNVGQFDGGVVPNLLGAVLLQSFFTNEAQGLYFKFPSEGALISGCQFVQVKEGITVLNGKNTVISGSTIAIAAGDLENPDNNSLHAIFAGGSAEDVQGATGPEARGLRIDRCSCEGNVLQLSQIALGNTTAGGSVDDVVISDVTLTNRKEELISWDLLIAQAHGVTVQNCVFDSIGIARTNGMPILGPENVPLTSANVRLGLSSEAGMDDVLVSDVIIRDCVLEGKSQTGIFSDTGAQAQPNRRITIENCSVTAEECGIVLNNTASSTVINTRVKDVMGNEFTDGVGIKINGALPYNDNARSMRNEICKSSVSTNENGIIIARDACDNVIAESKIFNNICKQLKANDSTLECDNLIIEPDMPPYHHKERTHRTVHGKALTQYKARVASSFGKSLARKNV